MTERIMVELGAASYVVNVGRDLLPRLDQEFSPPGGARRAAIVTQEPVAALYAPAVQAALGRHGLDVVGLVVPDGESAKSVRTLERLYDELADAGFGRSDLVVALGGGVVGDLAGLLAGTWNRGIALLQVPTTLLAQVDAAIGGKAAINLERGKNLVGCFHQPIAVIADVVALRTLPPRELLAGLGEVVKYGVLADHAILDLLEQRHRDIVGGDLAVLEELVARCVRIKARIVADDEREAGMRAHLNLGHTYGHALEALTGYERYRHGEAVAIGLRVALRVGVMAGMTPPALEARVAALLARCELPTVAPRLDREDVWRAMGLDKKAGADGVRFVLIDQDGQPTVAVPTRAAVDAALDEVEETV